MSDTASVRRGRSNHGLHTQAAGNHPKMSELYKYLRPCIRGQLHRQACSIPNLNNQSRPPNPTIGVSPNQTNDHSSSLSGDHSSSSSGDHSLNPGLSTNPTIDLSPNPSGDYSSSPSNDHSPNPGTYHSPNPPKCTRPAAHVPPIKSKHPTCRSSLPWP